MRLLKDKVIFLTCFGVLLVFGSGASQEREQTTLASSVLQIPEYSIETPILFAGEKLFYEIRWKGIKAAEAELEIEYAPDSNNKVYYIKGISRTTGMSRRLWRMDDWTETFTNAKSLQPTEYRLHIRETLFNNDMSVTFSRDQTRAKSLKISRDRTKERHFQCHHAYDPGSAVLLIRSLDWKQGQTRWFEIVEGNDRHLLIVEAIAEETVKVKAGTFTAIKLAPSLINLPRKTRKEDEGLLQKIQKKEKDTSLADEVYVWMAKEGRRPIVKTWAKAFIGYVELELVRME